MRWTDAALLFAGGIGGGLAGSIAGLASLASYPALLAVGLPPVTANVTNTVALVFNGIGSVLGSRPELAEQGASLRRNVAVTAVGGACGAALLLLTPGGFERIVPFLLGFASLTILLPRPSSAPHPELPPSRTRRVVEALGIFLIAVYGGYFGAAAGVVFLALLLQLGARTLAHANAAKNVLLGVANLVAAVLFAVLAPVNWLAVIPLGLGCLIGARVGPVVVRQSPATLLRILIGLAGIALAVKLWFDAY